MNGDEKEREETNDGAADAVDDGVSNTTLRRRQRLVREALTGMAGHALNNPLGYILMNLELVKEEIELARTDDKRVAVEAIEGSVDDALDGAVRLKRYVQILRALGGAPPPAIGAFFVDDMVKAALAERPEAERALVTVDVSAVDKMVGDARLVTDGLAFYLDDTLPRVIKARGQVRIASFITNDRAGLVLTAPRKTSALGLFDPFIANAILPDDEGDALMHGVLRIVARTHGGDVTMRTANDVEEITLALSGRF